VLVPFTITVNPLPIALVSNQGSDTLCEGDTAVLFGTPGMTSYLWQPDGETTSSIQVTESGAYSVVVENSYGCISLSPPRNIVFVENPYTNISINDTTVCIGAPVTLTVQPPGNAYNWYLNPLMSPVYVGNPYVTPPILNTTILYIKADDGLCKSDLTKIIINVESCELMTPANVFTPNGDGNNDRFSLLANDAVEIYCKIFNRWGRLIYEGSGREFHWDGTVQPSGELASGGVYYYIADIILFDGNKTNSYGFVELIR
jgi:gliding motility-associated-like protein